MGYLTLLSVTKGRVAGLWFVLGAALGIGFYGIVTALGLHQLLLSQPQLYRALQWMGVAYFLFLAWEAWAAKAGIQAEAAENEISRVRYFWRGVTTNLLNPKLLLFYVGVMPRFLAGQTPPLVQDMLMLVAIYVAIASCVHLLLVMIASQFSNRLTLNGVAARAVATALFLLLAAWMTILILQS
jgi:threonine/homoserine/homoserine lactone efflux protein